MDLTVMAGTLGITFVTGGVSWLYFRTFVRRVEKATNRSAS
jgi:hypothetical protein